MQSWNCVPGGKGFVFNEILSSSDAVAKSKIALMDWDSKNACSFGNNMIISSQQAIENRAFGELTHQQLMGKQLPDNSAMDAFSVEDESSSRLSSSAVDSKSKDSSFIDLKLGSFSDPLDAQSSRVSKEASILSSPESTAPSKRLRLGMNSQTPRCQVYGCNKDLSSSKEYHKRHKVCEAHSKTAKVIVNGIEKRFCQQCSRFHLLAEFDDGKRSCRKRLAGHNERRRKPQVGLLCGRTERLLQSYNGFAASKFCSTTLTSFICHDVLPTGPLHPEKFGTDNWCRRIKVEDGSDFSPVSSIPVTSGRWRSIFCASTNQYPNDLGDSNSDSRSLIREASLRNEDFTAFDALSTIQGLSEITSSSCALSLLSDQSHNYSSHASGISMACPLVVPCSNSHYSLNRVSKKLTGASSQASTGLVPNKFSSSGTNSAEGSHLRSIVISDFSDAIDFDITDAICQSSNSMNAEDHISCEDGATIDLLQLSSQLQRVECQKQSMHVKQENDAFCWAHII